MRNLRIGYWPLSNGLTSAGDRRRLVFWAKARGHTIITDLSKNVDVIVATEKSDFNSLHFATKSTPVVFDLVDAYLSPLNSHNDLARGLAMKLSGQISGSIKPFSHHVRDFCKNSSAVICSSVEQEKVIKKFNENTHVILDSHEEIPFLDPAVGVEKTSTQHRILWEGQPATIRGIKHISTVLSDLSTNHNLYFDFVTDLTYFKILNRYIQRETFEILTKDMNQISERLNLVPWTSENLVRCARNSSLAMIPIDLSVPMQYLKPENRLLIMWRLGIPCLTSPSPAYIRVSNQAGVSAVCSSLDEWSNNFNQLLFDPKFARNEIRKGQDYLREHHQPSLLLNKWDRVFESVLDLQ